MRRELLVGFLLVAAVSAVYWPVHSYPFVILDDPGYVYENPHVRQGLTRDSIAYAFNAVVVGNWHPLTMLSHMLDCRLFGAEESAAGWHHMVNVGLHAVNTVLLLIALSRMTGAFWQSALVAALFGLHPLHAESVAWISERKDVLSTFFFLLVLLAYRGYARRPSLLRYAAVFVLLALGLMCKPMLVTAPLVLLLLDYWPLDRMRLGRANATSGEGDAEAGKGSEAVAAMGRLPLGRLIVEKIPLLLLIAFSALVTLQAQRLGGALGMLGHVPWETRLGNAVVAYGMYLEKCCWPSPLVAVYPYVNPRLIDVLVIGLALAAISVAVVRLAKIRPFLFVGWCWYVVTLVPVIGLVQVGVQSMADRYTYIPLIGIFIIAVWGAAEFTEAWPVRGKAAVAVAVLAACGCLTYRQVGTWSNSQTLFRHAVESERDNILGMYWLGTAYWKAGKLADAQTQFEDILKVQPDLEPALRALGLLLAVRGQPQKALEEFDEAIHVRPEQPEPLRHKAWLLATSPDESVRDGKTAVYFAKQALQRSAGEPPEYWDTLAAAQAEAGEFDEAVASAKKALEKAEAVQADDLIPGIRQRLEFYESGHPYHAKAARPQRM